MRRLFEDIRKASVHLRNLYNQDHYDSISAKKQKQKTKSPKNKASRWNSYKHISVYIIHVIYRGHLRNVIM